MRGYYVGGVSGDSERFRPQRLGWFEAQASAGLVGAIDYERTGSGTIVCKGGFQAGTFFP